MTEIFIWKVFLTCVNFFCCIFCIYFFFFWRKGLHIACVEFTLKILRNVRWVRTPGSHRIGSCWRGSQCLCAIWKLVESTLIQIFPWCLVHILHHRRRIHEFFIFHFHHIAIQLRNNFFQSFYLITFFVHISIFYFIFRVWFILIAIFIFSNI